LALGMLLVRMRDLPAGLPRAELKRAADYKI
jgi:hypothetical protein